MQRSARDYNRTKSYAPLPYTSQSLTYRRPSLKLLELIRRAALSQAVAWHAQGDSDGLLRLATQSFWVDYYWRGQ